MAASPTRSSSPSSSAPRGQPRSWSRATSPSTPSATELAWTRRAPARPWPAASSAAPARPNANATSDTRSGGGRSGARTIDSRVDSGRLNRRLTGPSEALLSERRNARFAARASWGCPRPATSSPRAAPPPAGAGSGPGGSRHRPDCGRLRWLPGVGGRTPRPRAGTRGSRSPARPGACRRRPRPRSPPGPGFPLPRRLLRLPRHSSSSRALPDPRTAPMTNPHLAAPRAGQRPAAVEVHRGGGHGRGDDRMEWAGAGDLEPPGGHRPLLLAICRRRRWLVDDLTADLERRRSRLTAPRPFTSPSWNGSGAARTSPCGPGGALTAHSARTSTSPTSGLSNTA
jgi:hypothetical protein